MQGEIDKRVDKYNESKEKKWKTNKVRVKDLMVFNYWEDDCPERDLSSRGTFLQEKLILLFQRRRKKQEDLELIVLRDG